MPSRDPDAPATRAFVACHRLASAELPAHRVRALLEAADDAPCAIFELPVSVWQAAPVGLTEKQVTRLSEIRTAPLDPKLLERATETGAYALLHTDPAFPANMRDIADTPPLLFVRGELLPDDRYGIAVVGTRRSSPYGNAQAARFAAAFAAHGLTLVSGGALGIDAAAHTGALDAGGRTVAVLGCGIDIVYPAVNRALFERIMQTGLGAIVSEFPLGTKPEPWRFPTRNRIIAALSRASLLVETPDGSGALGTARFCAEYGRDVYVVPGAVDTGRSRGGHRLIGDGAILADSPEDVLMSLGVVIAAQEEGEPRKTERVKPSPVMPVVSAPATPPPDLPPGEAVFLAVLRADPQPFDTIAQIAELSAPEANVAATMLEMKSLIRRHPGNLFSRA